MNLKINVLEFDIHWLDLEANLAIIENRLRYITGKADILVLPELCLTCFCMDPKLAALSDQSLAVKKLLEWSSIYGIALIGSLAIVENGCYYIRVLLLD